MNRTGEGYQAPFPWFGGKSRAAGLVWERFGDVTNYVEPFFGSGAVLFARPGPGRIETVNDKDHWIANFWRAVQHAPAEVARWADNPVNEDDLTARHIWLVKHGRALLAERIPGDPEFYDARIAGWWAWGLCCWIGSGWCLGVGPWWEEDGKIIHRDKRDKGDKNGVKRQLVHLGNNGKGVNRPGVSRQLVHLGDNGKGVNRPGVSRQLVCLGTEPGLLGAGVWRERPELGDNGNGVNRPGEDLGPYFEALAQRLRRVRVCAGDWKRVLTRGVLYRGREVGIFLDPPYDVGRRHGRIYGEDLAGIADEVRAWCLENGDNPRYRIALCGLEGEHNELEAHGWEKVAWTARGGYSKGDRTGNPNRRLERIWFNVGCCQRILGAD